MSAPTFFGELKRRQIYRGGVMYVVAGWVIVQVATQVFPFFDIPNWAIRLVIVAIMLGFPIALVALWMFESSLPMPGSESMEARGSEQEFVKLMATERAERQRETAALLSALKEQRTGRPDPEDLVESPLDMASLRSAAVEAPTPARMAAATPTPAPAPEPPPKRWTASTVLLSIFAFAIVLSGIWALVTPDSGAQAGAASSALAKDYLMPGVSEAQRFGVMLLTPVLHKLGVNVDPERVFLMLVLIVGFLVVRSFYREFTEMRYRRARARRGRVTG